MWFTTYTLNVQSHRRLHGRWKYFCIQTFGTRFFCNEINIIYIELKLITYERKASLYQTIL